MLKPFLHSPAMLRDPRRHYINTHSYRHLCLLQSSNTQPSAAPSLYTSQTTIHKAMKCKAALRSPKSLKYVQAARNAFYFYFFHLSNTLQALLSNKLMILLTDFILYLKRQESLCNLPEISSFKQ